MTLTQPPILRYLSHPQVQIDVNIPVPKWGLSETGIKRANALINSRALANNIAIISSTEKKAIETAKIIALIFNKIPEIHNNLHENDRSSTGFLKPDEFEKTADSFFAQPEQSICGWERAIDVQSRIVKATMSIIKIHENRDILMVGHGAVGTLLMCHFARLPISRQYDQPVGGGNFFSVCLGTFELLHQWLPMEEL